MPIDQKKALLIITIIISGFILIVASTSIYVQSIIVNGNVCGCFVPIPLLIPFFASLGLLIGSVSYYIFSIKSEKPKFEILMRFLDEEEKKVMGEIIKGKDTQAKITKSTGLSRVKVHRIINRLIQKGLIVKEKEGKVVRIKLNKEIENKFSF